MASITGNEKKSLTEKLALLDKVAEKMNKKYGKNVMGRIGADAEIMETLRIKFIPTPSIELNEITGGGFPRRRCTIITGKEDSGKTSLVLETIAKKMQDPNEPNFVAAWVESEHSLEKDYICDTFGIDPNRFFYVPLDKSIGSEKTLDIVQSILELGVVDLFCINSLNCLVPDVEMEKSLSENVVALSARRNSRLMRKFTPIVAEYDTAFILICHLSTDIGSMSRDPLVVSGGLAIRYWSALTLDLRKKSIAPGDPIEKEEGMKIGVTVRKNHCVPSRNPDLKMDYFVVYGEGIEQYLSNIDPGIKAGILEPHGAWLYWLDLETGEVIEKFQSRAKFREIMRAEPDKWKKYSEQLAGKFVANELDESELAAIKADEKALEKMASAGDEEPAA